LEINTPQLDPPQTDIKIKVMPIKVVGGVRDRLLEDPTKFSAALRYFCGETPGRKNSAQASQFQSPSRLAAAAFG
jgi:hypothetical protein